MISRIGWVNLKASLALLVRILLIVEIFTLVLGCRPANSLKGRNTESHCEPVLKEPSVRLFPATSFSWTDHIQLGYLFPDGKAGIVSSQMDLPANAFDAVRVHVSNKDTGHFTPIPPTGWTWMLESALADQPKAQLVSESGFRIASLTGHQARWQANVVAVRAQTVLELNPDSDRSQELIKHQKLLQEQHGVIGSDITELVHLTELDLKRRARLLKRAEPLASSFHLDLPFFGANGVVIINQTCPDQNGARSWAEEAKVDVLLHGSERSSRILSFFSALFHLDGLKLPLYIAHDRLIEGFDLSLWEENKSPKRPVRGPYSDLP